MHWTDSVAAELLKNGQQQQVICTGTSLSGEPHLGSANDVIRGDAVRKAVVDAGGKAELVWIADDLDPYRSVPAGFPESLRDYLGFPVARIPDPWGCHKNFVHHFEEMFLSQLKSLGVEPSAHLGLEMYQSGMYDKAKVTALERRPEIITILNKYRKEPLNERTWWPLDVVCEKCGRVATTEIKGYNPADKTIDYACSTDETLLHKQNTVRGCGHKGTVSILGANTKITWRVEWACRWQMFKVTCEPFGKEHAASGGSWDTGKEIVKLFGWQPPLPLPYEFFQVEGGKMSKSRGNVITVPIMLEVMRPEELKFWMYYGKITKARELELGMMPIHVAEEFDKAERIFFGEKTGSDKDDENYKRSYGLSVLTRPKRPVQVPYNFAAAIVQTAPGRELEALRKTGHIPKDATKAELASIEARLQNARNWLEFYAPDDYRMTLVEKIPRTRIAEDIARIFAEAADRLEAGTEGEQLQQFIYNSAKEKNLVKPTFTAAYQLILGRDTGPRLGLFLASLDKDFIVKRLRLQG
jgi:lysyl-tRNA synthetase class 1